jgi:ComF family protein
MTFVNELAELIFPTRCYGCNRLGLSICTECRREWIPHYYKTHVPNVIVHSALLYTPTASKILLAAKENSIQGAEDLLISAITHVLRRANFKSPYFQLVPIPSSKSTQRRRGRSFMVEMTKRISQEIDLPINDCLQLTRRVADQSGLTRDQRKSNLEGAFSLKPGAIIRGDLILIDDVVTTGATLSEAARALNSQGFHALGTVSSVTACVAQPLR